MSVQNLKEDHEQAQSLKEELESVQKLGEGVVLAQKLAQGCEWVQKVEWSCESVHNSQLGCALGEDEADAGNCCASTATVLLPLEDKSESVGTSLVKKAAVLLV